MTLASSHSVALSVLSVPFNDDDDAALFFVLKYEASEEATTTNSDKTPESTEVSEIGRDPVQTPGKSEVSEVPLSGQ